MKVTLVLLALYAVDFVADSSFGRCAWAQRWGNTLSASDPADEGADGCRSLELPGAAPIDLTLAPSHSIPRLPASHPVSSGVDRVYATMRIRC